MRNEITELFYPKKITIVDFEEMVHRDIDMFSRFVESRDRQTIEYPEDWMFEFVQYLELEKEEEKAHGD